MAGKTAAGAKLFIGGTEISDPNAETQSSLEGYSYTEIAHVQDLGTLGDAFNVASFNELGEKRTLRVATFRDGGELSVTLTFDNDASHDTLISALGKDFGFKIELDDVGITGGSPASPTTFYFVAMPTSNQRALSDGSNVITRAVSMQVQSDVFEVDAV